MLSWIESWWHKGTGLIAKTALNWIHIALHAIGGIIHTVFGAVDSAWQAAQRAFWLVFGEVVYAALLVYEFVRWIFKTGLPDFIQWVYTVGRDIWHEITAIYNYIVREIKTAISTAERWAQDLWNWAYKNVIQPIIRDVASAWDWITKRGEQLWYYLTHPDKLADLLLFYFAGAISRASDAVLTEIGKILVALFLGNVRRFLYIIEDIVSSVL